MNKHIVVSLGEFFLKVGAVLAMGGMAATTALRLGKAALLSSSEETIVHRFEDIFFELGLFVLGVVGVYSFFSLLINWKLYPSPSVKLFSWRRIVTLSGFGFPSIVSGVCILGVATGISWFGLRWWIGTVKESLLAPNDVGSVVLPLVAPISVSYAVLAGGSLIASLLLLGCGRLIGRGS
jgi:hypothetical protein